MEIVTMGKVTVPARIESLQDIHLADGGTRTRTARTAAGMVQFGIYDAVRLTVQDRECIVEVAEIPDDCPVLIGQLPLEGLDFIVDTAGGKLIGNPDHGGKQMIDMFLVEN